MAYLPVLFGYHNWGGASVQDKINGMVISDLAEQSTMLLEGCYENLWKNNN